MSKLTFDSNSPVSVDVQILVLVAFKTPSVIYVSYLFELDTKSEDQILSVGVILINIRIPIFMLTIAKFVLGNQENIILKQQFKSCKLIVNVSLVKIRQNFNE